jgi:hypothetical protein
MLGGTQERYENSELHSAGVRTGHPPPPEYKPAYLLIAVHKGETQGPSELLTDDTDLLFPNGTRRCRITDACLL